MPLFKLFEVSLFKHNVQHKESRDNVTALQVEKKWKERYWGWGNDMIKMEKWNIKHICTLTLLLSPEEYISYSGSTHSFPHLLQNKLFCLELFGFLY